MIQLGLVLILCVSGHSVLSQKLASNITEPINNILRQQKITDLLLEYSTLQPAAVVIENVSVLTLANGDSTFISNQDVYINKGVIQAISPHGVKSFAHYQRLNGKGKFLIPGLIDSHVHLSQTSNDEKLLNLINGVTTIRDLCSFPWYARQKIAIHNNRILAPNLLLSTKLLNYSQFDPYTNVVKNSGDIINILNSTNYDEIDFIKVWNNMPLPLLRVIDSIATQKSIPLVGHIPQEVSLADLKTLHFSSIEHFKGYYNDASLQLTHEPFIKLTKELHPIIVPTLIVNKRSSIDHDGLNTFLHSEQITFIPKEKLNTWRDNFSLGKSPSATDKRIDSLNQVIFKQLPVRDVTYLSGTDFNGSNEYMVAGFALLDELRLMADNGLSNLECIKAATVNAAKAFNQDKILGSIEPGKRADLVLLTKNPLEDLNNLYKPDEVFVRGIRISSSKIESITKAIAAIYSKEIVVNQTNIENLTQQIEKKIKSINDSLQTPFLVRDFASILTNLKYSSRAIKLLEWLVERFPYYYFYNDLGLAYLAANDSLAAATAFEASLKQYKYNYTASFYLDELKSKNESIVRMASSQDYGKELTELFFAKKLPALWNLLLPQFQKGMSKESFYDFYETVQNVAGQPLEVLSNETTQAEDYSTSTQNVRFDKMRNTPLKVIWVFNSAGKIKDFAIRP